MLPFSEDSKGSVWKCWEGGDEWCRQCLGWVD